MHTILRRHGPAKSPVSRVKFSMLAAIITFIVASSMSPVVPDIMTNFDGVLPYYIGATRYA